MENIVFYFLNNGSAIAKFGDYAHLYDDMQEMASDYFIFKNDSDTSCWEGNEIKDINFKKLKDVYEFNPNSDPDFKYFDFEWGINTRLFCEWVKLYTE